MKFYTLSHKERNRLIRKLCNESNNIPIVEITGSYTPLSKGSYHWFRWLGKFKSYTGSYQASTRYIEVGKNWGKNINAPKGCYFKWLNLTGSCKLTVIRESDGIVYQPNNEDFKSKNFITRCRQGLASQYKLNLFKN